LVKDQTADCQEKKKRREDGRLDKQVVEAPIV
jgi:hypothetical protein